MDPIRWAHVKRVLNDAIVLPTAERLTFVNASCVGDDALRDEVLSLLDADDSAFLDKPAFHEAAIALARHRAIDAAIPNDGRIGEFRIVRQLGRGGMGTVYLAERDDGEFRRLAAVKVVSQGRDTELVVRRFRQERQILAGLEHPNIAQLFSGGTTDDGLPYFVMEYVEGEPIDQYCERQRLTTAARLELFRSVCAAVSYAHQRLVVHRDIKPANILVTPDGVPKLLDFGIAKLLDDTHPRSTTLLALTPAYASPEQRAGEIVTTLSDVYSLGVLLYQLVTGVHPGIDVESRRPSDATPSLRRVLAGDVDNIVAMAMRFEPRRRYASPAQLSEDIRRHLTGRPVLARPDTFSYRTGKFVRRNAVIVSAATVAATVIITAGVVSASQARIARQERVRADGERVLAERRFNEVRALATSFLFEVDSQIAPLVGAVPAREALVRRALASLDGLSRDAQNDRSLLRDLASAYVRVGDTQGKPYSPNLGHTAEALQSYRKGVTILEHLAQTYPEDVRTRQDLARALQGASAVQARVGDVDGAILTQRRAVALCETIRRADSANVSFRAQLADNLLWLGRALSQKNTVSATTEELSAYRRGRLIRSELALREPTSPARRYAAGVAEAYEGYALWQLGDLTGDTSNYRAALQRLQTSQNINVQVSALVPTVVDMRRASVDALREMAVLHVKLSDGAAALRELDLALPTNRALAATDPRNAEAQRDLAAVLGTYAVAHGSVGHVALSEQYAQRTRVILLGLRVTDTGGTDDLASLSRLEAQRGAANQSAGLIAQAAASYQTARDEARLWQQKAPTSDGPRRLLATHDAILGDLFRRLALRSNDGGARVRFAALQCDAWSEAVVQWTMLRDRSELAPVDTLPARVAQEALAHCEKTR